MPEAKTKHPANRLTDLPEMTPGQIQGRYHKLQEAAAHLDLNTQETLTQQMKQQLPRVIKGQHGWSATLFGLESSIPSNTPKTIYAIWPLLAHIADLWQDLVQEAVTTCPEPKDAKRQSKTKSGHDRIVHTSCQGHRSYGTLTLPSSTQLKFNLDSSLNFDGKAKDPDITWPFDLHRVSNTIAQTLASALANLYHDPTIPQPWTQEGILPKTPPVNLRLHRNIIIT